MKSTLVEPPSLNGDDKCAPEEKAIVIGNVIATEADDTSSAEESRSVLDEAGQRAVFERTRSRIERNLHVMNPLVRTVSQLGQQMLAGLQIMDFDSPRLMPVSRSI